MSQIKPFHKTGAVLQLLRPLYPYLDDPSVTEVTINRPGELWTMTPDGWQYHECLDLSSSAISALIASLISYNGLIPSPMSAVEFPNGERGQIIIPPAVVPGTVSLSIRKHAPVVKTLEQLDTEGTFLAAKGIDDFNALSKQESRLLELHKERNWRQFLGEAVICRKNIVVAGATSSGKTTMVRSLIGKVPTHERLVTIEDVHELHLPNHRNKVHMLHGQGIGRVSAEECLAACLRIAPDRIFLSEMRGAEAWEYLQSLNCGHPGSITTVHANSATTAFSRIAGLVKQSAVGRMLDIEDIRRTLFETIDVVVFMKDWKVTEVFYDPIFVRNKSN